MGLARFFCYLACACQVVALPARTQEDHYQAEAKRAQDLVKQLDSLITKAEREHTARLGLTTRYAPATEPDAKATQRNEEDLGTAILGVLQEVHLGQKPCPKGF